VTVAMIATHGLTHLALSVRDPDRSLRFYAAVFTPAGPSAQRGSLRRAYRTPSCAILTDMK
jgi:hypothetical protein